MFLASSGSKRHDDDDDVLAISTMSSPPYQRRRGIRTLSSLWLLVSALLIAAVVVLPPTATVVSAFSPALVSIPTKTTRKQVEAPTTTLLAAKGFGASSSSGSGSSSRKKKNKKKKASSSATTNKPKPYVKSEQDALLEQLLAQTSQSVLGRAVAESMEACELDEECGDADPFWELIPPLISSRFPNVRDQQLERVAGFIRHSLNPNLPLDEPEIINNKWRPQQEIHAYMPGLGSTKPFYDNPTSQLKLCKLLEDNYDIIKQEYMALMDDIKNGSGIDRFQSVTSMNYDSGWKTLVLFYNGHRIPGFPYDLCPITTRILETVPLAGRIAGFNRQQPNTGIPLHTDGNNMWLTTQMGICCPSNPGAHIRVGPDTRYYEEGKCLLYDTTYEHETFNENLCDERVVLHVDFFNVLRMTPVEIDVLQYIYHLREEFMKAEGVSKVGEHIL